MARNSEVAITKAIPKTLMLLDLVSLVAASEARIPLSDDDLHESTRLTHLLSPT